jgi:hypothetical protein
VERDFLLVIQSYLLGRMLMPRVSIYLLDSRLFPDLVMTIQPICNGNQEINSSLVIVGIQNSNSSWGSGEQIGNLLTSHRLSYLVIACILAFLLPQPMQQQITASSQYSIIQGKYHPLWVFI